MPAPITPTSPFPITLSVTGPVDGDVANAASVNTAFTSLQTDASGFQLLTYGGGLRRRVSATSNTVMVVQPLGAVVVKVTGVWTVIAHTVATTIDPETLAGGAFAANTRYYVYAAIVAGALAFSVSTTAPDVGLRYKTGDEQYFFVTTFFTDSAPDLLPYTQDDNRYTYSTRSVGATGNCILNNGVAVIVTSVAVGDSVPATASAIAFQHQATATAGNATSAVGFDVNSAENIQSSLYPLNAVTQAAGCFEIPYITPIEYLGDAATTHTYIWVTGFTY